jgi:hypothetical protein
MNILFALSYLTQSPPKVYAALREDILVFINQAQERVLSHQVNLPHQHGGGKVQISRHKYIHPPRASVSDPY